jgi:hypothetical protein
MTSPSFNVPRACRCGSISHRLSRAAPATAGSIATTLGTPRKTSFSDAHALNGNGFASSFTTSVGVHKRPAQFKSP